MFIWNRKNGRSDDLNQIFWGPAHGFFICRVNYENFEFIGNIFKALSEKASIDLKN